MIQCPHCHEQFEIAPQAKVPWWKYDPGPSTRLGCGTLILIAIIVALFSNGPREEQERILRSLQKNVQTIEKKLDTLGDQVRKLSESTKPRPGHVLTR
jgi:hypothetical protein